MPTDATPRRPAANPAELHPLFLKLAGRRVVVVGGGPVALGRVAALAAAGADLLVVAPEVRPEIVAAGVAVRLRPFEPADLDGAWLAVAAATPEVAAAVRAAAEERRIFVNAVDAPAAASAYAGAVLRRDGVTVAVSTGGRAPALAGLLRERLEALLPPRLAARVEAAAALRERWKAAAVPLPSRRRRLAAALAKLDAPERPVVGLVSLVGAGPGDPGLLTVAAVRRLEEADLVLHDALVSPAVLRLAPRARRFPVGKRAGRPSVRQETIHRLLVAAARRGERVVRLKAGDPFVLGRGGEEVLALAGAGIPHEVIPGISSALAAPALAGIPVTHRGLSAAFTVVSGHAEEAFRPIVSALPPGAATLVVLMGLATRARLAALLLAAGWAPETPAAALLGASTPEASTWIGTLAELPGAALGDQDAPGTLVIGAVVEVAAATARATATAAAAPSTARRRAAAARTTPGSTP